MINKILLLLTLILTTSCLSRIENNGYSFNLADYEAKKGLSSKMEVSKNMGSPTIINYIDGEELWIYLEEEVKKLLFFKPQILKRKILLITFDKNNIVKNLNQYDIKDENHIVFSKDKTKIKEIEKGFFADISGNIGQIKAQ